jgi:putative chitinase
MPFSCNFTKEALALMLPQNKNCEEWFFYMEQILPDFNITTEQRIAAFVSQCSYESGQFLTLVENLNYTAQRLVEVFPRYFPTIESALPYEHHPELLANKVYSNRMGNSDEASGQGYMFRGRGLIQLSGRANYYQCSIDLYDDDTLILDPDKLLTIPGAIYSGVWFWNKNKLNELADVGNIQQITKTINGGISSYPQRLSLYNKYLKIIS